MTDLKEQPIPLLHVPVDRRQAGTSWSKDMESIGPPPEGPLKSSFLTNASRPEDIDTVVRLNRCKQEHAYHIKHFIDGGDSGSHCIRLLDALEYIGYRGRSGSKTRDLLHAHIGDYTEDMIFQFKTSLSIYDSSRQSAPDYVCGKWTIGWLDQMLQSLESSENERRMSAAKAAPANKALAMASPMVAMRMLQRG